LRPEQFEGVHDNQTIQKIRDRLRETIPIGNENLGLIPFVNRPAQRLGPLSKHWEDALRRIFSHGYPTELQEAWEQVTTVLSEADRKSPSPGRESTHLQAQGEKSEEFGARARLPQTSDPDQNEDLVQLRLAWFVSAARRSIKGLREIKGKTEVQERVVDAYDKFLGESIRYMPAVWKVGLCPHAATYVDWLTVTQDNDSVNLGSNDRQDESGEIEKASILSQGIQLSEGSQPRMTLSILGRRKRRVSENEEHHAKHPRSQ
jgi:hypothetical protein